MSRKQDGFTIVELLVVVLILGILAAIALPKLSGARDKAKLASVRSDVRNTETAEEAYFSDNGRYATLGQLQATGFTVSDGTTLQIKASQNDYLIVASDPTITSAIKGCRVQVGSGVSISMDGTITCP